MLNPDFRLKNKGVSNALSTGDLPRHRWYFVKEGFSPKLVEDAIATEGVEKGSLFIDPFSGSGTGPLTAAVAGLKTVSFEVNPFLSFLSSAKFTRTNPKKLNVSSKTVIEGLKQPHPSPLEGFSTFTEGNRWERWLFNKDVLRRYEGGLQSLKRVPTLHRNILKLLLLGSALDCCNAERDGKCLRYKKNWRKNPYKQEDFSAAFVSRLKNVEEDLESTPLVGIKSRIIKGDARQLVKKATFDKFRLCVTSPPYLNSFDYSDIYRPELFLGRFVKSNSALMRVRLKTVRSHVQANWEAPEKDDFGALYRNCIKKLREAEDSLWDRKLPLMIQAYFEDMQMILKNLRKRALPQASAWFVVSTSAYGGVEIPVDLILAEIGQSSGWFLREVGVLRYLRSSGQQMRGLAKERVSVPLRESVVIFAASRPAKRLSQATAHISNRGRQARSQ